MAMGKGAVPRTLTLFPTAVPNPKQVLNGPEEELTPSGGIKAICTKPDKMVVKWDISAGLSIPSFTAHIYF